MSDVAAASPVPRKTERPAIDPERESIGRWLYGFAWTIEILAVIIGFAIALMQGMTSFAELEANTEGALGVAHYTNVIIAMLPFVMVAAVEITKIPFVGAAYRTSKMAWKWVFSAALVFLAFITFESALNGFERNFHALIFSIDKYKKELVAVEEEIDPLDEQREKLANLTSSKIEAEYNQRHALISQERSNQSEVIQDRIRALRAASQTEYVRSLQDQIDDRQAQIAALRSDRQRELNDLQTEASRMIENSASELNTRRRSLQQQLHTEQEYLVSLRGKAEKEIEDAGFFSESSVRKRYQGLIQGQEQKVESLRQQLNQLSDANRQEALRNQYQQSQEQVKDRYQKRIDAINKEVKSLNLELSKSLGSRDKDIEQAVANHMQELSRIEKQFAQQQSDNERLRDREFDKLARNEELIAELDVNLLAKKNRRVELRNLINVKVGDNQVYRMAQWWFGKESAADLDRRDVMFIASLWFGSLALLIAVTGILLALASYVIRDPSIADHRDGKTASSAYRMINSARRLLIYWRRLQRAPIIKEVPREVVREVPVDRVVMVDKPIEIIKKEIVHVPLYTEDKSFMSGAQKSQGEIKDMPDSKDQRPQQG